MHKKLKGSIFILLTCLTLAGCSLPGMHMSSPSNFSNTVDVNNQIVKPQLIQIDVGLVLAQKQAALKAKEAAIKNYKKPVGFTTDIHHYDYRIGVQDELSIIIWDYQSLTSPQNHFDNRGNTSNVGFLVNNTGDIFYPYIGYVQVQGLTISQARDLIAEKLAIYVKEPQITVQVIGFNSQKANVIGVVKTQAATPITNVPVTVLDAINAAGGMIRCSNDLTQSSGECADSQHVVVKHNGHQAIVDVNTLTAVNGESENWVLAGGSIVYVPNNSLYKVYILGDVKQTGIYNMIQGKMSLSDAIAATGGVSTGSAPRYTYVIRSYDKTPIIYHMNLRSPDAMLLAGQFELKPQDIVFVDSSALKDTNQVLQYISPIISTAFATTALAVSVTK